MIASYCRPVGTNLKVRGHEKKLALRTYFFEIERGIALCYEHSIFDGKVVVSFF